METTGTTLDGVLDGNTRKLSNYVLKDGSKVLSTNDYTTAEKNKSDIKNIYKRLESAFQKVGLVKYDAFQQMGGQLSFSLAVLDENDNGFIMNSVHSAEGCYSYTKEIKQGQCSLTLGDEEKMALDMAMAKP